MAGRCSLASLPCSKETRTAIDKMKLPTRILISAAMLLMLIGAGAADTHITTDVIQQRKVTRVATALNHVTIIELPEPVVSYSIGSDSVRVEYHDNRVLIKPTKPNVSTNLFVWTATSHTVYEILPAGDPAAMSYVLDQVFPAPPPAPEPSREEVERQTDTMYASALANQRLIRSGKLPHGLRFWYRHSGEDHCDACVELRVTRITEDASSYYVRVVAENKATHPYRLQEPAVTALRPTFSENIADHYMNRQISVDALREMGRFAPEPLRTHGSTLNAPRDLKAGESAEWIVGFAKPGRTPAIYQFSLPDDEKHPVTATVVF
jgi:hypothetical protein